MKNIISKHLHQYPVMSTFPNGRLEIGISLSFQSVNTRIEYG